MRRVFTCGHSRTVQPWKVSTIVQVHGVCLTCRFQNTKFVCVEITREVRIGSKIVHLVIKTRG